MFESDNKVAFMDSSIVILENALLLNDLSRREQFTFESKESRAVLQADITDLGINASVKAYEMSNDPDYLQKAFFFMEKNKGNILLDRIFELKARSFSGIPETLLENESRIRGELALYKNRLLSATDRDSNLNAIKRRYEDKLMEYINLVSEIENKYQDYYRLKYESVSVTAEQIRKLIPSRDKMIIQYYVGEDNIYFTALTRKKIIIKSTSRDRNLDKNLIGLLNQMNNKQINEVENDSTLLRDFIKYSRYLYEHLLAPVLNDVNGRVKEITIVPDGILCYLPFEILLTQDPAKTHMDFSALPYLLKDLRVSYDHSSSLIFNINDNNRKNKKQYLGFAPEYTTTDNLGRLSANRDEIEACRRIWKGTSFIGKQATETEFLSSASVYNIVHLAAHTVLNDEDPQGSCLVFTGGGNEMNDGRLYIHELYNMNLNTQLLILSACETGTGHIKRGEGIISLARAFRFAGCHNILMSLWKVNDRTAMEMMVLFNRNLKKGLTKDKALQYAKLKYIQGDRNLHPSFWASMILIGDQKQVSKRLSYKEILFVLPILFIFIFIIRKKLKLTLRNYTI
jgi:CHAT domain-containing protein